MSIARSIIDEHLVSGKAIPGAEIAIRIDQTLTQDATGTMVMLELEEIGLRQIKTELSVQYVDHNLLQQDYKNADDHLFLESACKKFGIWYSRAGNGISHVVHQERFGVPKKTLLGSDSHTPAAGSLGMLAFGAGGIEVALAMAGEPYYFTMPKIWGIELTGELPAWVSAKDVILEMLRRHGVRGGRGYILEYFGPGVEHLSVMDRHVIANMGAELGATSTVFPIDENAKIYLSDVQKRAWSGDTFAGKGENFDRVESIDLSSLEPLIAKPSSPGDVVAVREVQGKPIHQAYIGSSANPGYRDFAVAAQIVNEQKIKEHISFDINPTSRQVLATLDRDGFLLSLMRAGARVHQTGCNGCIGMGQAPASDSISLRTVPRNFKGRSGTPADFVYLASPETVAASAIYGEISDPRNLPKDYKKISDPLDPIIEDDHFIKPQKGTYEDIELRKGPNIGKFPSLPEQKDAYSIPVLLKLHDDISTDEILPAGTNVLPYRSNIPKISEYLFKNVDPKYVERCDISGGGCPHVIIAGENYGQGSSREHAALAPAYLGLRVVVAKSFARIHLQNLVNFGVLPLVFVDAEDSEKIHLGDEIVFKNLFKHIEGQKPFPIVNQGQGCQIMVSPQLSVRQTQVLRRGGLINFVKHRLN